jgi:hypothetical protein
MTTRSLAAALVVLVLAWPGRAAAAEPVSAFAAEVGALGSSGTAPGVTLYVVPEGRMLLVTDVAVANPRLEAGPLYLADSQRTRTAIALVEYTTLSNNPISLAKMANVHMAFGSGIPFGPGEPVVATLAGGRRGVDVTITGQLVRAPRRGATMRFEGGARERGEEPRPEGAPAGPDS